MSGEQRVHLQRVEPGSYGVHGHPDLHVIAHYKDWAVWGGNYVGFPWEGALFRGPSLTACREWLDKHAAGGRLG